MRSEYAANVSLGNTSVQRVQVAAQKPSSTNGLVVWVLRLCAGCACAVVVIKVATCFI